MWAIKDFNKYYLINNLTGAKVENTNLATTKGKEAALKALEDRRTENATKEKINNASLRAGSPMYFYCKACGALADTKPESYITPPKKLCDECQTLKDLDWLE